MKKLTLGLLAVLLSACFGTYEDCSLTPPVLHPKSEVGYDFVFYFDSLPLCFHEERIISFEKDFDRWSYDLVHSLGSEYEADELRIIYYDSKEAAQAGIAAENDQSSSSLRILSHTFKRSQDQWQVHERGMFEEGKWVVRTYSERP